MESQHKMILSDDGELREVTAEEQHEAVFCTHCGTANRADGHFCHTCGQPLDDQVVSPYTPPERKNKRAELASRPEAPESRRSMGVGMVIVELFTLCVMGVMFLASLYMHQTFIAIAILIGWAAVEAARHSSSH